MSVYEMASATHVALTIALCACDGGASVWWINQLPQKPSDVTFVELENGGCKIPIKKKRKKKRVDN